jgi:hypothetical protein
MLLNREKFAKENIDHLPIEIVETELDVHSEKHERRKI